MDVLGEVLEANESDNVWSARFYWEASSKPNLHAYQPGGWDDAIVVSSQAGTHTSDPLLGGAPAYVDWAFVNDGWNDISTAFSVQLYVDGVLNHTWTLGTGLPSGYYTYLEDYRHYFARRIACAGDARRHIQRHRRNKRDRQHAPGRAFLERFERRAEDSRRAGNALDSTHFTNGGRLYPRHIVAD